MLSNSCPLSLKVETTLPVRELVIFQTDRISVPVHGNQALKIGLLKHFMAIAGIDEAGCRIRLGTNQ
ncbi:MAG: hypothetical protein R3F40_18240 [Candidatus Competibacteraceae bacterium]